jgi:uncharacterized protein
MMLIRRIALCFAFASPAMADVQEVVMTHIQPGYAAFAEAANALATQVDGTCDVEAIKPAFHAAYDAWMAVQHIRIGPVEEDGRGLAIAFWPDPKALGAKAQRALMTGDPAKLAPAEFAEQSVAARGVAGLERLLYPVEQLPADPCPLIRATATDLAHLAAELQSGWTDGYGDSLVSAGAAGNTRFLTETEARQAMFTQLATGLEFLADQRLGRPLGDFDRPRPELAESRASSRSLRNVLLSLQAMRAMTMALTSNGPQTIAAFDDAIALAEALPDPVFADVARPEGRLKVEILQQAVRRVRDTAIAELAPALGVGVGFNSQDGD